MNSLIQHKSLDDLIKSNRGGSRGGRGGLRGRGGRGGRGDRGRSDSARGGAQRALDVGRQKNRGAGIFKKRDGKPTPGGRPQGQNQRPQNNQRNNNNQNKSVRRNPEDDGGRAARKQLAAKRRNL